MASSIMKKISPKIRPVALFALLACAVALFCGCGQKSIRLNSDSATTDWNQARYFQAQGRYDLAREHYLLALAAARDNEERDVLNQELQTVDLQIKTLR